MDPVIQRTIEKLHGAHCPCVIEFAGAGSLALAWLHAVGGSSRTILEATDRYCAGSMEALLGGIPKKYVEPETAAAMAERAYLRARRLGGLLGVACTATIATDYVKRGGHRCCVAVRDRTSMTTFDLVLAKGKRDRAGEEKIVAELLVGAIAGAAGVAARGPTLLKGEKIVRRKAAGEDALEKLAAGRARWVVIEPDGKRIVEGKVKGIVYCGSFNPLHFGHEALAAEAGRLMDLPVTFELAARNAEKAPMSRAELERRLGQFDRRGRVVVTNSPLFVDKAKLFPRCVFLVGYDTAVRVLDGRFYSKADGGRDGALAKIGAAGCRFLVAGRVEGKRFRTVKDLSIPAAAQGMMMELPDFRADVSATELRGLRR